MAVQQVGPETFEMNNASVKMTLHEGRITSLLDALLGCVVRLLGGYQADETARSSSRRGKAAVWSLWRTTRTTGSAFPAEPGGQQLTYSAWYACPADLAGQAHLQGCGFFPP